MITRLVKQMEADGWVLRRTNPVDNRYMLVRLSELGFDQHRQIMLKIEEIESKLMVGMNAEEIACFERCLIRIRQNAENLANGKKIGTECLADDCI
jgi:DNA-binding MarR family transcriptional regulator